MSNEQASVNIVLESETDGQKQERKFAGEWFRKGETIYLRYEETDEMYGAIRTLIRWRAGELQVTRRGGVDSEQRFIADTRLMGRYSSPHTKFAMEIETTYLQLEHSGLPLRMEWHYGLQVNGQRAGLFKVRLQAEEAGK
ncbi:DUF1934 domain-containing protein [Paenibacillus sp. GCM10027626]|uniref:DUF1934 domain-containing protein n=1 Tax=Paenibacillus sp. GCM10027626 TaxID=3273411 RepID=UPI00363C7B3B